MSDILIKGMEMPESRPVCIVIDAVGQARRYDLNNDRYADDELFEAVPADVQPVMRGTWINEPIKSIRYHCSVCQGRFDYTWHYCPNCGAKMEYKEYKE